MYIHRILSIELQVGTFTFRLLRYYPINKWMLLIISSRKQIIKHDPIREEAWPDVHRGINY
jgi:hypothetical protein